MNYKLFLPPGARESGQNVILASGISLPRYAFVAVPIIGLKGNSASDLLSGVQTNPVYYDTRTNSFTLSKKVRNVGEGTRRKAIDSLSTSEVDGLVKFNFDGYVNVSTLIQNIKQQVQSIKEKEKNLVAFEQDPGYTSVRLNDLISYEVVTIDPTDDWESIDYRLSEHLTTRDLLTYQLKPQTLLAQDGVSKNIVVRNLKNLAVNVYEPVLKYLLDEVESSIEVFTAFTEKAFYAPDEEFYLGEAVQFRFPGFTPASVYLIAKDMISSLFFDKLYLEYYLESEPRITVIVNGAGQGTEFGTRFEHVLVHPNRLVNVDKSFDFSQDESPVLPDGSVNPALPTLTSVSFNRLDVATDRAVLTRFIKDALDLEYLQSEENAIKFAFQVGLNISDVVVDLSDPYTGERPVIDSYFEPTDYANDYASAGSDSDDFNDAVSTLLPALIRCPTVSNGSVSGSPRQDLFPMMSHAAFRALTDVSMVNNPEKSSGEYGVPQAVRFNNPFLVDVIKGVTDKVEDGFVGAIGGKAVYANRLGGLIAGLRKMQGAGLNGKTMFTAGASMLPTGVLAKFAMNLAQAFFNVNDPTGTMLSCKQMDSDGNVNDQIVAIGMMLAALVGEKKSPYTYEEIGIALAHLKGDGQFNKTVDGQLVGKARDTSKEMTHGATRVENTANSRPIDIANVAINSVKALVVDALGVGVETKNQRKESQTSSYEQYDSGSDHRDRRELLGAATVSTQNGKKDSII